MSISHIIHDSLLTFLFIFLFCLLDNSVRDGLYHEFKKHGDVARIFVNGQGSSRYAIVHFRRYSFVTSFLVLGTLKFGVLRTSASFYMYKHFVILWKERLYCHISLFM